MIVSVVCKVIVHAPYVAGCTEVGYVEALPNGRWERVEGGFYFLKSTTRRTWFGRL
jgi:hypothetical protein